MYLPQFHEVPENDEWWGKGFTEWTTVKAASSLFDGHDQPKKPLNNNYYNLLDKSTMLFQNELIKKYGIGGLCFYHYYFREGKQILEKPAENLLKWTDIDTPFCFCWANESWARTWSNIGNKNAWSEKFEKIDSIQEKGKDVLLEQKYGREDEWRKHFEYLLPFFKDERYIKKDGAPIFLIYKPEEIGCLYQMTDYWKKLSEYYHIPGIYFIGMNTVHKGNGLNAIVLNAPNMFWNPVMRGKDILPIWTSGIKVFEYEKVWDNILSAKPVDGCKTYFGGFVNYDDTPRRNKNGMVIRGGSVEKFRKYLFELYKKNYQMGNEFVFINAWNEWGEGMYLEPDEVHGFRYLEAVQDAKNMVKEERTNFKVEVLYNQESSYEKDEKLQRILNKQGLIANCLDNWMLLKEKEINPAEYLRRYNYKTVAVYGMGILGKHLLFDLERAGIEIAYIIDRRVDLNHPRLEIKSVNDVLEKVDAVVVTAIADFDEIYEVLRTKVKCPVLSISELISEV